MASRRVIVVVASLVLGGMTSFAQGWLPDSLNSLSNSSSGWTILTVVLILWSGFRFPVAAVAGAVSFVLLVVGYTIASELRGLTYNPTQWGVIGLLAGPFVGTATAWLRERDHRGALGTGLLAGIGIGEAVYGLTVVDDTTSPVYWTIIGVVGALLLIGMLTARLRGVVAVIVALSTTVVVAGGTLIGYQIIG